MAYIHPNWSSIFDPSSFYLFPHFFPQGLPMADGHNLPPLPLDMAHGGQKKFHNSQPKLTISTSPTPRTPSFFIENILNDRIKTVSPDSTSSHLKDVCNKNNGKHSFHSLNGSTLTRREELLLKTSMHPPVSGLNHQQQVKEEGKEEVKSGERRKRGEKRSHCDMIEEMMRVTVGGQDTDHDTCHHSPSFSLLSSFPSLSSFGASTIGGLGPHRKTKKMRKEQNTLGEDCPLPLSLSKNGPVCGASGVTSVLWWPHPSTSSSSFSPSTTTMTISSTPNTATTSSSSPFSPSSSSLPSPPPAIHEGEEERRINAQDERVINGQDERNIFHSSSLHFSPAESSASSTSPSCDGSESGREKRMKQSSRSQNGSKSKRIRTIFKADQLEKLESEFMHQQYMVGPERRALAASMGLSEAQVKVWFQNRRIKWRKQTDEETKRRMVGDLERIVEGTSSPSQPLFNYH